MEPFQVLWFILLVIIQGMCQFQVLFKERAAQWTQTILKCNWWFCIQLIIIWLLVFYQIKRPNTWDIITRSKEWRRDIKKWFFFLFTEDLDDIILSCLWMLLYDFVLHKYVYFFVLIPFHDFILWFSRKRFPLLSSS